tara:strand:- start:1930 stop:2220 length:291 start_codon:yes stop_codon:yes gene_type:complete
MTRTKTFSLGRITDTDPDVLSGQIVDAITICDDTNPVHKSLDTLTAMMQKVAEGKLTASAAISITKSAGLHDSDVEDAILAQSVIGRRAIATGGKD